MTTATITPLQQAQETLRAEQEQLASLKSEQAATTGAYNRAAATGSDSMADIKRHLTELGALIGACTIRIVRAEVAAADAAEAEHFARSPKSAASQEIAACREDAAAAQETLRELQQRHMAALNAITQWDRIAERLGAATIDARHRLDAAVRAAQIGD